MDASAWVEVLCGDRRGSRIVDLLLSGGDFHVPALCDIEVAAALRKLALRGVIPAISLANSLALYGEAPVTRHDHRPLLPRIFALRQIMTAYDAAYVALAEGLGAEFLTFDGGLRRTVAGQTDVPVIAAEA